MRIRMLTTIAGPTLAASAGQEIEVDAETATALLDGGFAEALKAEAETAAVEAPEKTTAPAPKRRAARKPRAK